MEQRSGRTSMAMKFFAVWIIFPLCLAAVCISQRAAAVTMGYAGANSNPPPTCDEKTGVCTLTVTIGGYSAPSGNPSDYGMCGILGVYGNLARAKEARITIAGNQYQATLVWTGGGITPPIELEWTCVHLTEFSGLPAAAKFEVNQPSPVTSSSGSASSRQIAGEPDACIWTGIARLPSSGDDATTFDVSTQAEFGRQQDGCLSANIGRISFNLCLLLHVRRQVVGVEIQAHRAVYGFPDHLHARGRLARNSPKPILVLHGWRPGRQDFGDACFQRLPPDRSHGSSFALPVLRQQPGFILELPAVFAIRTMIAIAGDMRATKAMIVANGARHTPRSEQTNPNLI